MQLPGLSLKGGAVPSPYPVPGPWMWWDVGKGLALYRKGCLLKQGKQQDRRNQGPLSRGPSTPALDDLHLHEREIHFLLKPLHLLRT